MYMSKLFDNGGVSLLEVMIGMIVIAIGLLGLAPMIVVSIDGNSIARDNNVVSNLIKQKIEQFECLPSDSLPGAPFSDYESECKIIGLDGQNTGRGGFTYSRSVYLNDSTTDNTIPGDLYELKVKIEWIDNKNVERNTTYSTYLLKNS